MNIKTIRNNLINRICHNEKILESLQDFSPLETFKYEGGIDARMAKIYQLRINIDELKSIFFEVDKLVDLSVNES
jgi:hypothetical protein